MRLAFGLATAGFLVASAPTIADACSAPACWPGLMTPNAATPVPQNLPGIYWKPQSSYNNETSDPTMVVLANASAPSTPVPFTATAQGDGSFVLVPTNPLVEGATYTVTDTNMCDGGSSGPTATFQVSASSALPTVSGTLSVQNDDHLMIDVATASGSCSATVLAHSVDISMNLQSYALPWAAAFHYETYVDGTLWSRSSSINVQPGVAGTWRLYRVCDAMDQSVLGSGLTEGAHEVTVKATLPGTTIELWTEPLSVTMACPGEDGTGSGSDVNGDGDGDDEVSGCSAGGASSAWLLVALVGLYSGRRKRQR